MATVVSFNGKRIIEPGVYSQIKSGIPARPNSFSFGNLMIIDTGSGAKYGGGSGINGQFANGLNAVYSFDDVDDFKAFVKGGLMWDLADYIFNPLNGASGPETVYIARAAETTPAEINLNLVGGGANGGTVTLLAKNEGEAGNGKLDEQLAEAVVRIDLSGAAIGQDYNIDFTIDGTVYGFNHVLESLSTIQEQAAMADAINSDNTGVTAYVRDQYLILVAPDNTGDTWNDEEITLSGDVVAPAGYTAKFQNGVNGTKLIRGYAAKVITAETDGYLQVEFYEGTYNGATPDGNHYGGLEPKQTKPDLLTVSPEFNNIDTFIQWAKNDFVLGKIFGVSENYIINGDGSVDEDDVTDLVLAENGSETYNPADLDRLLDDIRELDNTFFLSDRGGDQARSVQNMKILNHIQDDAEFDKFLIVAGGDDETKFEGDPNSSIEIAKFFDTTDVIVVHSGINKEVFNTGLFEKMPALYHAANFAGRLGGLESQVPATFKALRLKNFRHVLGMKEREKALQAGVIHNRFVPGIGNVVNQAVNSLQRNTQLINTDGTSFEISIMRIGAQLNKELTLNMRPLFVGNNRGTVTAADVKSFVEGYLLSKTATTNSDNLIISFKNITVRLIEDYYDVKYGFVPNGPINKLFNTGFMLDTNLSA